MNKKLLTIILVLLLVFCSPVFAKKTAPDFLPVPNSNNIEIGYTVVTNRDYAKFIKAMGKNPPSDWTNGTFPKRKADYPVVNVSYNDAVEYCKWLTQKDGNSLYRLPTEHEWELSAGVMPKEAKFNSSMNKGLTKVNAYKKTISASGAIDMWGNVWEWTSTQRINPAGLYSANLMAVKGGAWNSSVVNCRTDYRNEGREPNTAFENVGFRIVRVK